MQALCRHLQAPCGPALLGVPLSGERRGFSCGTAPPDPRGGRAGSERGCRGGAGPRRTMKRHGRENQLQGPAGTPARAWAAGLARGGSGTGGGRHMRRREARGAPDDTPREHAAAAPPAMACLNQAVRGPAWRLEQAASCAARPRVDGRASPPLTAGPRAVPAPQRGLQQQLGRALVQAKPRPLSRTVLTGPVTGCEARARALFGPRNARGTGKVCRHSRRPRQAA